MNTGEPPSSNPRVTILVVEDSPTQAERLRHLMEQDGYRVLAASDGNRALTTARAEVPDLVISDVVMPGMDGFELCRTLRTIEALQDTPVVLLTSLGSPLDVIKGLECGADNFIRKPYGDAYLLSRVRQILANRVLRKTSRMRLGIEISLGGQTYHITSERQQILDLLISTYEQAVQVNEELVRSQQVLGVIHRMNGELNLCATFRAVVDTSLQYCLELPDITAAWMILRDDSEGYRVAGALGLPGDALRSGALEGDCLCRRKLAAGELSTSTVVVDCERFRGSAALIQHAVIPLWLGDQVLGLLNVAGPRSTFGEDRLKLLYTAGNQVAIALARTRLREDLEKRVEARTTELSAEVARREAVEEALRASELRLRAVFNAQGDAVFVVSPDLVVLDVNPAGERIFGYPAADLRGQSVAVLHVDERRFQEGATRMRAVWHGGSSIREELELRRKDGSIFPVEHSSSPLRSDKGETVGAVCVIRDLTEVRKAEESHRRLVSILDATPDFVGTADPEGRPLFLNRAGREMLGLGADEDQSGLLIGDTHPKWAASIVVDEGIPAAIRDGVWSGETAFLRRDGKEIPVSQVIIAHKDSNGNVEFLSTIARDISERRSLEEQLRQSQKMDAVGRLAGGIAHDFNNLLTVIRGYGAFVLEGLPVESPLRRDAAEVLAAAERASTLTRQLLLFSRKQRTDLVTLDLGHVIANFEKVLRRVIGEDVALVIALGSTGTVRADSSQLDQVLMNLCVNARDAMPNGGRLVIETADVELDEAYCRGHLDVRPGPYALLSVSDTGAGMDAETQARIFEPFFTTKGPGRGTGLGLSIVYGIVRQGGGHIRVYSEPNHGTTFKIYLPRQGSSEELPPSKGRDEGPASRGTETVLLVEDEPAIRRLFEEVLTSAGYTVLSAEDGAAGVAVAERHKEPIHIVITDVVMPGMGGPEMAGHVAPMHPEARWLFLSGYAEHAMLNGVLAGVRGGFLEKPVTLSVLVQKVREVLETARP